MTVSREASAEEMAVTTFTMSVLPCTPATIWDSACRDWWMVSDMTLFSTSPKFGAPPSLAASPSGAPGCPGAWAWAAA